MSLCLPYIFSTDAIYLGKNAKGYLQKPPYSKTLKIHSVFKKVINLESDIGLLSVVSSEMGRLSNYIVVYPLEDTDFLSMNLCPKTKCIMDGSSLIFDIKLCINFKASKEWQGVLDKGYKWEFQELKEQNISALRAALNIYGKKNSAFKRIYENKDNLNLKASEAEISSAVYNLIGFGLGLTPSGDDILTGLLSVITSCSEELSVKRFIIDSTYKNLYRTNYISGNMLINSTKNIYHEYIQDLIYAVVNETPEKVIALSKRLMKIGATSGSDIAAGIYIGFANALESKVKVIDRKNNSKIKRIF